MYTLWNYQRRVTSVSVTLNVYGEHIRSSQDMESTSISLSVHQWMNT